MACSSFAAYNVDLALAEPCVAGDADGPTTARPRSSPRLLPVLVDTAGPLGRPEPISSPSSSQAGTRRREPTRPTPLRRRRSPQRCQAERLTETTRTGSAKPLSARRPAGSSSNRRRSAATATAMPASASSSPGTAVSASRAARFTIVP